MASHYKVEYRLAFSGAWGFEFKPSDDPDNSLLGERIGNDVRNITNLLYKYCNVDVVRFDSEKPFELLEIIKEHLSKDIPIGIFIDTFWCPWLQGRYQRVHDVHHCLIIGIDAVNNLYCLDPALNLNISVLMYNDFINGCKNCVKYEFNHKNEKHDYLKIIKESTAKLNNKKFYYDIKVFAKEFRESFDFSLEYQKFYVDVWYVLIDRNLRLIASGRTLYAEFIELVSKELQSDKLLDIKYELQKVASKWNKIRGILTKSYRKGCCDDVKEKVYYLLNEISDFEETLINNLYQIVNSNLYIKKENNLLILNDLNYSNDTKIVPLNLADSLNNKAFAVAEDDAFKADLTGIGQFFITNGLEHEQSIQVNSMYFKLPQLITEKYDNISCTGQKIIVEKSIYQSIMFLGCSDNGDFIDETTVFFENGEELKIPISFTDSWRLPKFNESIAWTGMGGKWTEDRFEVHSNKQRIFAREDIISTKGIIEAIKLPDCSNIHIFSISLRKLI
jgi:hypothetical protein